MTSRERVRKAIRHEVPDRVPFDLGSTTVTGIHVAAYSRLKQELGIGGRVRLLDPFQMLAEVEEPVRKALGVDTLGVYLPNNMFGFRNENWKPWKMSGGAEILVPEKFNTETAPDGSVLQYPQGDRSVPPSGRMPKNGNYFDNIVRQPRFQEAYLDPRKWVEETFSPYRDEDLRHLEKAAREGFRETEYALVGNFPDGSLGDIAVVPGPHIKFPTGIRDPEEWYVSLVTRKNYIQDILGYQTELALRNLELYRQAVGDRIDMIDVSEADFGTQEGPLISPAVFRELFKPFFRKMNDWVHRNTHWKTFYHSCGSIAAIVEDFIDMGADIINPVQYGAADMGLKRLKKEYGGRIVFWGGAADNQKVLPFGRPEEVGDEVARNLEVMSPGGGYVFGFIHNLQPDVPAANMVSLVEAFHRRRDYA